MFEVELMANGNLKLRADQAAQAWIGEQQGADRCSDTILMEGTERFWTNGSYTPFDAGQANPFVGLTCAPCIAETMSVDEVGKQEVIGRLWFYERYQLTDPMEVLKTQGEVVFDLAH